MVPINSFWIYEPHKVKVGVEWLRLKSGDDTLASFQLQHTQGGQIVKNGLILRIGEVARGRVSKLDVFISLRNSPDVTKLVKDSLWGWREKFFRIYPPEDFEFYAYLASPAKARAHNEYLQTPEGIQFWTRCYAEAAFEYVMASDITEGIRNGSIKVN